MSRTAPDFATAIEWAKQGEDVMTKCPAHDDGRESLHVSPGEEQPVVFRCHAGCQTEDVMAAAGTTWDEVCRPLERLAVVSEWTPRGPASAVYSYTDEQGTELFQTLRIPQAGSKTFMQRHCEGSKWVWNLQGVRRVLYHLPAVLRAAADGLVILLTEGEKDVEVAMLDGLVATCNPMGAGKWSEDYSESLRGAEVWIVQDNDTPGRNHGRLVAEALVKVECKVRVLETTIPNCKDYADHRAHGGTVDTLVEVWSSQPMVAVTFGLGIRDFLTQDFPRDIEVIPNLLARSNIVLLTGFEGIGKSLLLRQMAMQAAAGIHPFELRSVTPRRVLYIDAENPEHQQAHDWRMLAGLAARTTGAPVDNEMLTILSEWRAEPDLTTAAGLAWLCERVMAYKPDIVCIGPVQNIVSRDVKDDEVVRKLKTSINTARSICGSAFIIEHHSPWRMAGDKERSTRPYGSSLFNKWPDFGYGLKPTEDPDRFDLYPNRLPRVRSRAWPESVVRGKEGTTDWPWMEACPLDDGVTVFRKGFVA